jgi:uncharacterized YigZ family protein
VQEYYFTISKASEAEYKDKGSRFIAYALPVHSPDTFKKELASLKALHPKADHHCFAYRIGPDRDIFRSSDDREPSGTAGKPILGQIDSKQLTNVAVVVVRYFGGTLLGVPGLIDAYKTVTSMVLQLCPVVRMAVEVHYELHFNYTHLNEIMRLVKQRNLTILSQDLQLFCTMIIGVAVNQADLIVAELENLHDVEVRAIT